MSICVRNFVCIGRVCILTNRQSNMTLIAPDLRFPISRLLINCEGLVAISTIPKSTSLLSMLHKRGCTNFRIGYGLALIDEAVVT